MYDNKQEPILIAGVEGGGTTFVLSIAQLYPTQINTNSNCTHQTLNQTLFTQKIQYSIMKVALLQNESNSHTLNIIIIYIHRIHQGVH